jgi:hypothetical protein
MAFFINLHERKVVGDFTEKGVNSPNLPRIVATTKK